MSIKNIEAVEGLINTKVSPELTNILESSRESVINDVFKNKLRQALSEDDCKTFDAIFDVMTEDNGMLSFDDIIEQLQSTAMPFVEDGDFDGLQSVINDYNSTLTRNGEGSWFFAGEDYSSKAMTVNDLLDSIEDLEAEAI